MECEAMTGYGSRLFVPSERQQWKERPWFGELPAMSGDSFTFAVVGDRCGMATAGVFERAMRMLTDLRPDFVISVGDSIEGYESSEAVLHAQWAEFEAIIRAAGLPYFPVVGNHDYSNRLMADVWRTRKGTDYYGFRIGDTLFLMLNTEQTPDELPEAAVAVIRRITADFQREPERAADHLRSFREQIASAVPAAELKRMTGIRLTLGEEQLAFVERMLGEHQDVKRTFVTMHKPGWKSESTDYARLMKLLDGRAYTLLAGHLHELEYERDDRCEQIQMGRTGGMPHGFDGHAGEANMVLWVTVRQGQPSYRVIPLDSIRDVEAYAPNRKSYAAAGREVE